MGDFNSYDSGTLTLNFEPATAIEAGRPYIVKWATTGDAISNPEFSGVTISSAAANVVTAAVTFMGNYDYKPFTADDKSILFLGNGNTLYYPLSGASIGACRAYFQLNGITVGNTGNGVRAFKLNFGEDETTGILEVNEVNDDSWYSLDGRKLGGKPSRAGVYINKGIKVVMK